MTELLNETGAAASVAGAAKAMDRRDGGAQAPLAISVTAGDPTITVYGRNSVNDEWVQVAQQTASWGGLVTLWPQMRADLTFGTTAADAVVSVGALGRVL